MKIELQEPFSSIWTAGYLVTNPENRRNVLLRSKENQTTISYARYLMCVKLGYILSSEYEVDHIDDDKTNDHINNLQVLTKRENQLKEAYRQKANKTYYLVACAFCDTPFTITERQLKMKLAQNVEYAFCSRSCAGSFHSKKK
jgi:hypothetical protein